MLRRSERALLGEERNMIMQHQNCSILCRTENNRSSSRRQYFPFEVTGGRLPAWAYRSFSISSFTGELLIAVHLRNLLMEGAKILLLILFIERECPVCVESIFLVNNNVKLRNPLEVYNARLTG